MSMSLHSHSFEYARKWSDTFVETGTHVGGGVLGAVMAGFKRIFTCDLHPELIEEAKRNMGVQFGRVNYFVGQSWVLLPRMLKMADCKCAILLDAHAMSDTAPQTDEFFPLRAELEALAIEPRKHLILIDDIDLCGTPHLGGITLDSVETLLERDQSGGFHAPRLGQACDSCMAQVMASSEIRASGVGNGPLASAADAARSSPVRFDSPASGMAPSPPLPSPLSRAPVPCPHRRLR